MVWLKSASERFNFLNANAHPSRRYAFCWRPPDWITRAFCASIFRPEPQMHPKLIRKRKISPPNELEHDYRRTKTSEMNSVFELPSYNDLERTFLMHILVTDNQTCKTREKNPAIAGISLIVAVRPLTFLPLLIARTCTSSSIIASAIYFNFITQWYTYLIL